MIKPTVGRVVWYRPGPSDFGKLAVNGDQPLAAIVSTVWNDRMVNIAGFDANGMPFNRTSVTLVQEGDAFPAINSGYVEWMPFQIGQAKKHEAEGEKAA
ncbi:hypothetical protein SAMN06265338_103214 [Rhodoblastus acidophilus]|uniref:Uncharacterized protein n=1 Tax=Rhodoblastus acidophilus TaxID=1074 RepID=A0A212RB10_RHOAC|nr:hypothetical protein [Rhodoblastus acidophilus]SNB69412.1 hypothetical protein SAMN06265338_103214 [Rhodoblastus acidophilus]